MKTAKQKANFIAQKWHKDTGAILRDGKFFISLVETIEQALKEQDHDTRHACAEACLNATKGTESLELVSKAYHDTCMNVQAV